MFWGNQFVSNSSNSIPEQPPIYPINMATLDSVLVFLTKKGTVDSSYFKNSVHKLFPLLNNGLYPELTF